MYNFFLVSRCADVLALCEAVHNDVSFASVLAEKYPSNVFLLRYEDFILDPSGTLDILLNFLELPPEPSMDAYLEAGTRSAPVDVAITWMQELTSEKISLIQKTCWKSMEQMGYNTNFINQMNLTDILTKTKLEVWPYISLLSQKGAFT